MANKIIKSDVYYLIWNSKQYSLILINSKNLILQKFLVHKFKYLIHFIFGSQEKNVLKLFLIKVKKYEEILREKSIFKIYIHVIKIMTFCRRLNRRDD